MPPPPKTEQGQDKENISRWYEDREDWSLCQVKMFGFPILNSSVWLIIYLAFKVTADTQDFTVEFFYKIAWGYIQICSLTWDQKFNIFEVLIFRYMALKLACCRIFISYFGTAFIRYLTSIILFQYNIFWYLYYCGLLCAQFYKFIKKLFCWPPLPG